MNDYRPTPTTDQVRADYIEIEDSHDFDDIRGEEFDTWLSSLLASERAEAHREGWADAICHIYATAADDPEVLDEFMDFYEPPTIQAE